MKLSKKQCFSICKKILRHYNVNYTEEDLSDFVMFDLISFGMKDE